LRKSGPVDYPTGRPSQSLSGALVLYYWGKGEAEYSAHQYENAVTTLRHEAIYGTPSRSILAAALAQLGRLEDARVEGRLFMADHPDLRKAIASARCRNDSTKCGVSLC
jgi:hypothetical protein